MVMTILEAHVSKENWPALESAFKEAAQHIDAGLERSLLVHSTKEPGLWRIITIWQSREALDKMRSSGETPRGVLMFRSANAEPSLSIFDIAQQIVA